MDEAIVGVVLVCILILSEISFWVFTALILKHLIGKKKE
jgi:hypothetical protein